MFGLFFNLNSNPIRIYVLEIQHIVSKSCFSNCVGGGKPRFSDRPFVFSIASVKIALAVFRAMVALDVEMLRLVVKTSKTTPPYQKFVGPPNPAFAFERSISTSQAFGDRK